MAGTQDQVRRRLCARVDEAFEEIEESLTLVDLKAVEAYRSDSAQHYGEQDNCVQEGFRAQTRDIAQIVAAAIVDPEARAAMIEEYSRALADRTLTEVEERRTCLPNRFRRGYVAEVDQLRDRLEADIQSLKTDVSYGIAWSEQIGPPAISQTVINIQGIGQVSLGNNNRQEIKVHSGLAGLVKEIDAILSSAEFSELPEDDRRDMQEVAEDLIEEAQKPAPDASRVRKWGDTFLRRLKAAGMMVAHNSLNSALLTGLAALITPTQAW